MSNQESVKAANDAMKDFYDVESVSTAIMRANMQAINFSDMEVHVGLNRDSYKMIASAKTAGRFFDKPMASEVVVDINVLVRLPNRQEWGFQTAFVLYAARMVNESLYIENYGTLQDKVDRFAENILSVMKHATINSTN